ncbi:MAG: hypothetical protein U0269_33735 [Polyangiales bacterium]
MASIHHELLVPKLRAASDLLRFRFGMAPFDIHADGELEGVVTRLAWVPAGISGDVTVSARLSPSLGLGLRAFAGECGAEPRAFALSADDLTIASQLVTNEVRAALEPVMPDSEITISDHEVLMRRSAARSFEPAEIVTEARAIAAAAAVIDRNRESLPALSLLAAHAESAARFASENGLRSLRQPPSVRGARPYGVIQCGLERVVRSRYTLVGRVSLSDPALQSIALTPTRHVGLVSRAWAELTGADLHVGDKVFDAEFVIKATDAERARAALAPNVREAILAIGLRYGDFTMSNGLVSVGPAEVDLEKPESVAGLAAALDSLANALSAQ